MFTPRPVLIALSWAALTVLAACSSGGLSQQQLENDVTTWRVERVARLTREDGWLTVVGLLWLHEGDNRFGSGAQNELRLQHAVLPDMAGTFTLQQGKVIFTAAPDAAFTQQDSPVSQLVMQPDTTENPANLSLGPLNIQVIERGGRFALRIRDRDSIARKIFTGLNYFPVDTAWRKQARYEPYHPVKKVPIVNIIGMTEEMNSPGAFVFEHEGQSHRLDAILESPDDSELFVMFADATSGRESYGAGRYLYVPKPTSDESLVWIDFNRAYNPPCAFTEYATCPLPPRQNRLTIAVTAGEKKYSAITLQ